ncbi:MAG: TonB-dependent receptor, partial [Ferruginibacter sp.]
TNTQGVFSFVGLVTGSYDFQVSAVGYTTLTRRMQITNLDSQLNFQLSDEAVQLEGVVVTAQKKEEFVQKVPLSISVISSKQVSAYRLWNSKDLTAIVPNLYSAHSGDERNVTAIRGIATTSYDPAITTYIDGVNQFTLDTYIANLFDVERIEVIRGPQGTLYGRNAMGGVINIITKQPGNKMNGFAEISAGNYDQQRFSGGIRTPLVKNKLFFGVSGLFYSRDGFYSNSFNNTSFDKQHGVISNSYLKFIPTTKWAITLNAKHQNIENNGAFPLVNGVKESFDEPFVLNQDAIAKMTDKTFNGSLSVNYSGRINFSSQTSYQSNYRKYNSPLDGDFSPIDGITIINDYGRSWNNVKVWTQELKVSSGSRSGSKLNWTLGNYLFKQDNPVKQAVHFGNDAMLFGAPDINFSIINETKGKSTGIAFFGQASYQVIEKVNLIAGLRYDHENKKYNIRGQYQKDPDPTPLFDTRPDTSASVDFNAFSPKVGLAFNVNSHSDAFLTYSRGFRTGGMTPLSSDPSQPPLYPYKPEYSDNIEAGIKNNLFNNRLQFNVFGFLTYVTDAQVPTLLLPDAVTVTKNAGKLVSKGVELEAATTPVKGLQVNYSFGYTHATYKNLKLSQNGSTVNLEGKKQIYTPDVTSMLALQYTYNLGTKQQLKLIAGGEWSYLGRRTFDLANTIEQHDNSVVNIRLGMSAKYISLIFWIRNLADEKFIAYAYDFGAIHLADPQSFGVTLSAGF